MSRRTKTVTLTNRHGEEQKMKLEPLRAISKRLWVRGHNIRSARKPEGSKVWTEFSRFDQHLYRAFKDERIELAWQDDSSSSKSKVFAYEECVLRYVEHYLARWARKSPKTKMMTIAGTVDLLHEPQFPEEHGKKGKVMNNVQEVVHSPEEPTKPEKQEILKHTDEDLFGRLISDMKNRVKNGLRSAVTGTRKMIAKPFQKVGNTIAGE